MEVKSEIENKSLKAEEKSEQEVPKDQKPEIIEKETEIEVNEQKFEYLIFGFGIIESIVSGGLATHKKPSVNLEPSGNYSGTMKTLTLRELTKLLKEENENVTAEFFKDSTFDFECKIMECAGGSIDTFTEKYGLRDFNIDMKPKVIFSTSKATERMIEAQVDNYISFQVFRGLFSVFGEGLSTVPTHKGEIFSCSDLSLQEKKELFNFLSVSMRYYNKEFKDKDEQNSINDFKKNVYAEHVQEVSKLRETNELKEQHFLEFLKMGGLKSKKLIRMVAYSLCNYRINPFLYQKTSFEDQSTHEMLIRLARFVESLNYHSVLPYLYPIYGTGDVSQIFSRISSVYGSVFMLGKDFKFGSYEYIDNKHQVEFEILEKKQRVICDQIFLGREYHDVATDMLKIDISSQISSKFQFSMRRIALICKTFLKGDEEENPIPRTEANEKLFPILISIPDEFKSLNNENPISVIVTDNSCGSCSKNFSIVYIDYILNNLESETEGEVKVKVQIDQESLQKEVIQLLLNKWQHIEFRVEMVMAHSEIYQNPDLIEFDNKVSILPDDDIGLDFEMAFDFGHSFVTKNVEKGETEASKIPLFNREGYNEMRYGKPEEDDEEGIDEIDETSRQLLEDLEGFDF